MKPLSICVIGNSHLAAVKLGHERSGASFPQVRLDFFGSVADHLWDLEARGSTLAPATRRLAKTFALTSGGRGEIDTAGYDAFILVGLGFGISALAALIGPRRPYDLAERSHELISRTFLRAASHDVLARSLAVATAGKIARACRAAAAPARILLIPSPFPSAAVQSRGVGAWSSEGVTALLRAIYGEACEVTAAQEGIEILRQPEETVTAPAFTRPEYSVGSVKLTAEAAHPEEEHRHMNADYGAIVLKAALDRVVAACGSDAPSVPETEKA